MRARAAVIASLASAVVLGTGWELGSQASVSPVAVPRTDATGTSPAPAPVPTAPAGPPATSGASTGPTTGPATVPAPEPTPAPQPTSSASATPTPSGTAAGTFTGTAVQTRFGTVQVAVTIQGGTISDVSTVQLSSRDGRSAAINSRAVPVLRSEVLQAQSANVQNVSGATYTSSGYLTSLQAALDAAGF